MPKMTCHEVLSTTLFPWFRARHFVHTEGVTGSIPVAPTIQALEISNDNLKHTKDVLVQVCQPRLVYPSPFQRRAG